MGSFSWVICVSSKKSKVSLEGKDDGQRVRQGNVESRGRKWRFQDATLVGSEDEEKSHEPKKKKKNACSLESWKKARKCSLLKVSEIHQTRWHRDFSLVRTMLNFWPPDLGTINLWLWITKLVGICYKQRWETNITYLNFFWLQCHLNLTFPS